MARRTLDHTSGLNTKQWELVLDAVDHPIHHSKGALVRHRETNDFALARAGTILSVPQGWALRQAKAHHRGEPTPDSLQDICIARAEELRMSTYAIHKATGGAVAENTIENFLSRRSSMTSQNLQHVFRALDLKVVASESAVVRMDLRTFIILHPHQWTKLQFSGQPTDSRWNHLIVNRAQAAPTKAACPCKAKSEVALREMGLSHVDVERNVDHIAVGMIGQCPACGAVMFTDHVGADSQDS